MNREYITTPIFYVNDIPHIGHAYTMIIADILSRYHNAVYLTGTDEHGQKVFASSKTKQMQTIDFCNLISNQFLHLTKELHIKNNYYFIRTTSTRHKIIAKKIWNTLKANDMIYKDKYSGWYSESDECFYKNDSLINGKAPTGATVEYLDEDCLFFRLSQFTDDILEIVNELIIFPAHRKTEIVNYINKGGLNDLAISRNTQWGISVEENQTMYVWIDALTSYLDPCFPEMVDENPLSSDEINNINQHILWKYSTHIIGKDILNFHAIYWLAILKACKINPPRELIVHGWLLIDKQKMSKSLGNVIDPIAMINKYGADAIRFALVKEPRIGEDGEISEEKIISIINNDLANNIGNLFNRSINMMHSAGEIHDDTLLMESEEIKLEINISEYIYKILKLCQSCNRLIEEYAPWTKEDKNPLLFTLYMLLKYIAHKLKYIIPDSANQLLNQLNNFRTEKPSPVFLRIK